MKLFDRFSRKPATTDAPTPDLTPVTERTFIDDLIMYFSQIPEVNAAYFGFVYNAESKVHHLFLAVDHNGEAETVKQFAWIAKCAFMNDTAINYASSETDQELVAYISQHNPPFYHKDNSALLQEKIMKQWFNVELYQPELIATLQRSEVITLAHKFEPTDKQFDFATYMRDKEEFIPLFSNNDMIRRGGMAQIPDDRVAIKLQFDMISRMIGKQGYFILNPFTPFEVELRV